MEQKTQLNLCNVQKPDKTMPVFERRQKLIGSLESQLNKIRLYKQGQRVSRHKFWIDPQGAIYFQVKYGKVPVEIQKGKSTLKAASFEELEQQIDQVKQICFKGDLDEPLAFASKQIRTNFKKTK